MKRPAGEVPGVDQSGPRQDEAIKVDEHVRELEFKFREVRGHDGSRGGRPVIR